MKSFTSFLCTAQSNVKRIMFASAYLKPRSYIRGPDDKEIPIAKLNRYGLIIYAVCIISFLATIISYMTMSAYQVETVSVVSKPIDGQNCTILASFNGALPRPTCSLSGSDLGILMDCLISPTVISGSFGTTAGQCPAPSQYNSGPTVRVRV
jgi:hypothetical protein